MKWIKYVIFDLDGIAAIIDKKEHIQNAMADKLEWVFNPAHICFDEPVDKVRPDI